MILFDAYECEKRYTPSNSCYLIQIFYLHLVVPLWEI